MIKVLPSHSEAGTIRAIITGHLNEPIYNLTHLEAIQLRESLDEWFAQVKNGEHCNK